MTYFNTNAEQGPELAASTRHVHGQEAEILAYFERIGPESHRTGRQIRAVFGFEQGSISRALKGLTDDGHLEKCKDMVRCNVTNKKVHVWRLARQKPPEQGELF